MVPRGIEIHRGLSRLASLASSISRYDLLLAIIPLAFTVTVAIAGVIGLPVEIGIVAAGVVGLIVLLDGLFLRPPTGLQGV